MQKENEFLYTKEQLKFFKKILREILKEEFSKGKKSFLENSFEKEEETLENKKEISSSKEEKEKYENENTLNTKKNENTLEDTPQITFLEMKNKFQNFEDFSPVFEKKENKDILFLCKDILKVFLEKSLKNLPKSLKDKKFLALLENIKNVYESTPQKAYKWMLQEDILSQILELLDQISLKEMKDFLKDEKSFQKKPDFINDINEKNKTFQKIK